ncbi:MAG: 2-oxoacid:acceptor oxidoreductase family protein [Candidatus Bathyarchaeota archaeon]
MVDEIRLHGMGGQGVVAAGELIAIAALYEGKFCRAFPYYGSARRGAPVLAFAQIGEESEATRSMIYHPGYLFIMDPMMLETMDVTSGLKERGTILFNTKQTVKEAEGFFKERLSKLCVLDATGIAERIIGRPIPNTAMLGAFTEVSGILKLDSVEKAINKRFSGKIAELNIESAKEGRNSVEILTYEGD